MRIPRSHQLMLAYIHRFGLSTADFKDPQRWGSLSEADRIQEALEEVAQMHTQILREFEVGASCRWHDDEFAGGAFALFDPRQQTLLHD